MARPQVAVVTPSLSDRGGTESVFVQEMDALVHEADITFIVDASQDDPGALPGQRIPVRVPPAPSWLYTLAWFRNASRALDRLGDTCRIRYSAGVNARGLTHMTIHAIFAEMKELQAAVPSRWSPKELNRRLRFSAIAAWEARVTRETANIATVSQRAADLLAEHYRLNGVQVIRPAPDPGRFNPAAASGSARARLGIPDHHKLVACVGNAWHSKGLDVLLQAWSRLTEPELALVVVSGEPASRVKAIASVPADSRVHWLDEYDPIAGLLADADLVVLPSRGETYGLPIAEAILCGTTVLCSRHAGVSELLPVHSVVDQLDPARWADRIRAALATDRPATIDLLSPATRQQQFLDWLLGGPT